MVACVAVGRAAEVSSKYKALDCPAPSSGSTWSILKRNGANVEVDPYLSSLGNGESGTGVITSPPFIVATDTIKFTICGHDGQAGGQGKNYIALVDARKGNVLMKTPPPQNDAMHERSWDVSGLRNVEVRIEVHDGDGGGGFAWLGIGRIDAGAALQVDFRKGMPEGWDRPAGEVETRYEVLAGGVPFKRAANLFSLMPKAGSVEIPCGFAADRLLFLGCTAAEAKPLEVYGRIELHYRSGSPDVFPLMCGFTLDGAYKLLSPSDVIRLHASADPYQHYLAIEPRDNEPIEKIRLVALPEGGSRVRITAITCETGADSDRLMDLPKTELGGKEAAWIESHTISAGSFNLDRITEQIRKSHKLGSASVK
jgi:hypothetical protein